MEGLFSGSKVLSFVEPKISFDLPAYYFNDLPLDQQISKIKELALQARVSSKALVYEIGYGTSLSPLDSAGATDSRIVLAFDPQGEYPGDLRSGTEGVKIPKKNSGSLAAFFKLDVRDVIKESGIPKADFVYSIAPYPNLTGEIIELGLKLSDKVYVVPNPNARDEYPPAEIALKFKDKYKPGVLNLTKPEIEKLLGTSKSSYLGSANSDQKFTVIEVIRD